MHSIVPLARTDSLVVTELDDETLVYDLTSHQAHCLNRVAAAVWRACDGQTSVADIAARLAPQLATPVDDDIVWLALDRLGRAGLLQERVTPPALAGGMSRRDFIRKAAVAAAVAVPLVASLTTPRAAEAVSKVGPGNTRLPEQDNGTPMPEKPKLPSDPVERKPLLEPTKGSARRDSAPPKQVPEPVKEPAKPAPEPAQLPPRQGPEPPKQAPEPVKPAPKQDSQPAGSQGKPASLPGRDSAKKP